MGAAVARGRLIIRIAGRNMAMRFITFMSSKVD
jgi:hypothetical protein